MSAGRPSIFTQELADKICEVISNSSIGLRRICEQDGMPGAATVMRWLNDNEQFREQYARAKEKQADYLVDEIIEISDDGTNDLMTITKGKESYEQENKEVTSRSKLRVDARKWVASKLAPKKYGDKVFNHVTTEQPLFPKNE